MAMNHEDRLKYHHKYRQIRAQEINALKNKPCMDCHNSFPPECMDFDHRPGTIKFRKINTLSRYSRSRLFNEITKCDLVCANCHRIRTKSRLLLKSL